MYEYTISRMKQLERLQFNTYKKKHDNVSSNSFCEYKYGGKKSNW